MNRARATVARMNHFDERHVQRVEQVSESPMVVVLLCLIRAVVTDYLCPALQDESRRKAAE